MRRSKPVGVPIVVIFRRHMRELVAGTLVCLATFVLYYMMTVFALSWGTTALHYSRSRFLIVQLVGIVFFALTIPIAALLAERGRRPVMFGVTALIAAFGLAFAPLFSAGPTGDLLMTFIGLALLSFPF